MDNRNRFNEQEAIRRIEQFYHAGYNPNWPDFDAYEQLLVCESLAESEAKEETNGNVLSIGVDTCKRNVNLELTESKLEVISKLKDCNYKTPPIEVAQLLEAFFANPDTRPGYWLSVAQTWPPRRIYLSINQMFKRQSGGWTTIKNPAAYFNFLINRREKRKGLLPSRRLVNKS